MPTLNINSNIIQTNDLAATGGPVVENCLLLTDDTELLLEDGGCLLLNN